MKINTEKARSSLKEDWEEIRKEPIKQTLQFLKIVLITFIISLLGLYFLSRPLECNLNNNQTIHMEELKFNLEKEPKCTYTIIKDFKQMHKALTTKVTINQTEEGNPWEKTQQETNQ